MSILTEELGIIKKFVCYITFELLIILFILLYTILPHFAHECIL